MLGWQVAFNLAQSVLGDYNKCVGLARRWMFMTVTILELYRKKNPVVYNRLYFYSLMLVCQSVHLSVREYVQPFQVQSKISQQPDWDDI